MNVRLGYFLSHKGALDLLVFMGWGAVLVNLTKGVFLKLPILDIFAPIIVPTLYIIVALIAWPYLSKRIRVSDLYLYFLIVGVCLIQYVLYPLREELLNEWLPRLLFSSIPYFIIGACVDFERYEKPFYFISIACLLWAYLYSFVLMQEKASFEEAANEYMSLSYMYMPYVMYLIYYSFRQFNIIGFTLSLAGVFLIISYGSRGPLLCLVLFILGMSLFSFKNKDRFIIFLIVGTLGFLSFLYFDQILLFTQELIESVGMKTRIIDKYIAGELLLSEGREGFVPIILKAIKDGGLMGYGICGSWQFIGTYPHNLLLDFWISFGVFPGSLLFAIILYLIIKTYKSCHSYGEKSFLLLLSVSGFLMLFISYNFMGNEYLYFLLGYCVNISFRRKSYSIELSKKCLQVSQQS